jgi:signal transduction histidine kinase
VVRLHIIDNGVGFDSTATRAETHFGLTQLRERAAQVGGHLDIVSTVGGGTTVIATIPVHAQGAA